MIQNKHPGRHIASRSVRVKPEFREEPDMEKLARTLIYIVKTHAEKRQAEEQARNIGGGSPAGGKGDGMP